MSTADCLPVALIRNMTALLPGIVNKGTFQEDTTYVYVSSGLAIFFIVLAGVLIVLVLGFGIGSLVLGESKSFKKFR